MLASVLHSEVAINVSIGIMRAFVEMRRFIANNALLFERISNVELKQLEYQKKTDGLIIRAITLYCKAEFGFNNAAEQFRKSYDALKMRLSLSAEYNTAPQVSETDTNSTESGV